MTHHTPSRLFRRSIVGAALAALLAGFGPIAAQTTHSTRLIVASSPGSTMDAIARLVQPTLTQMLGAPLHIENIAGVGGVIAMQSLIRAPKDGFTLVLQTNNMIIAPLLIKTPPYDAIADFTPIAIVGSIPLAVVVNTSRISARSPEEFIALLKTNANKFNYGSSGNGTTQHLAWELVQDELGVKLNHVPYKGVAPMVNDLLAGRVDFAAIPLQVVQAHIDSGALRALATFSKERSAFAPNLPTLPELGLKRSVMDVWLAVLGPKGMSTDTVARVHTAVARTFSDPSIKDALEKRGNTINVTSPEQARTVIRADVVKYGELAKRVQLMTP